MMFYGLDRPGLALSARAELTRAFAAIELMRHVDESVPDDLVLLYLESTKQHTLGMSCFPFLYQYTACGRDGTGEENELERINSAVRATSSTPERVKKMAKDYLSYFWDAQVHRVLNVGMELALRQDSNAARMSYAERCSFKRYPLRVRQAIDGLVVTPNTPIKNLRQAVSTLHAMVCPPGEEQERSLETDQCGRYVEDSSDAAAPLTRAQINRVTTLRGCLTSYMLDDGRRKIPDTYDRGTICDLLEILVLLDPFTDYYDAYRAQSSYRFSRDTSTDTGIIVPSDVMSRLRFIGPWSPGVPEVYFHVFGRMSPHAALCLGNGIVIGGDPVRKSFIDVTAGLMGVYRLTDLLEITQAKPNVYTRLYLACEFVGQSLAFERLQRASRANNRPVSQGPFERC